MKNQDINRQNKAYLKHGIIVLVIAVICGLGLSSKTQAGGNEQKVIGTNPGELPGPKIQQKLKSIKIPRIDFKNVPLQDAVKYLQEQSKQYDPENVGINIILRRSPENENKKTVVNMVLANKTFGEVIHYFCMTNKFKFRVEENAVVIGDF